MPSRQEQGSSWPCSSSTSRIDLLSGTCKVFPLRFNLTSKPLAITSVSTAAGGANHSKYAGFSGWLDEKSATAFMTGAGPQQYIVTPFSTMNDGSAKSNRRLASSSK